MALIFQQPAGHKLEVDGESILQDIYQLVLNSVRLEAEIIEKMSLLHFATFFSGSHPAVSVIHQLEEEEG